MKTLNHTAFRGMVKGFLFLLVISTISGCGLTTRLMVDMSAPVVTQMNTSLNQNCDIGIMRDGMPFALSGISGLIDFSPSNREFLVNGAHAYFGYTFAFIEDTDPERASSFYIKARDYGLRAMFTDSYKSILQSPLSEFKTHVSRLKKRDVPAMFWTTTAWFSYIRLNLSDISVYLDIPKAELIARRLLELDETFYFGSPHIVMASFYSAQPELTGGNPEKAKEHFETAIKLSDSNFLMHHLFYARYYAVRKQDRELFKSLLMHIDNAPEDILPSHCAITNLCKMKAEKLLEDIDTFF